MPDTPHNPSAETPCPGTCNAGWRAAERRLANTGTGHDLEPREGQPVWCPPCTTAIRAAVADWPILAGLLHEEIESGVSAALTEYVSGSKNRPVHDHEAASFLLDEFSEWIGEWEATIRRELRLAARRPPAGRRAAIANATTLILAHLDWHLAGRADQDRELGAQIAGDFGEELLGYHRRAQVLTATQDAEPVRIIGVDCPMCSYKTLELEVETETGRRQRVTRFQYGDDGEVLDHVRPRPFKLTESAMAPMQGAVTGYIRCRRCRPTFRMSPEEYNKWTRLLAAHPNTRALATEARLTEIFGSSVPTQYKALR